VKSESATQTQLEERSGPGRIGGAKPNESLTSGRVEFISFSIGDEQYGVRHPWRLRENQGLDRGSRICPSSPNMFRGVLNLRGVMVFRSSDPCRVGRFRPGQDEARLRCNIVNPWCRWRRG